MFGAALKWSGVEMDADEVECIVANLIAKGYIKGYLSHKLQTLVVSKERAFPPLREVIANSAAQG